MGRSLARLACVLGHARVDNRGRALGLLSPMPLLVLAGLSIGRAPRWKAPPVACACAYVLCVQVLCAFWWRESDSVSACVAAGDAPMRVTGGWEWRGAALEALC